VEIREYRDPGGQSPFGDWRSRLDTAARRKISVLLYRLGLGNFSNVKGVGSGVFESKINFGPGYRVYFGKDGEEIVILLGGGTKQGQQSDIAQSISRWEDYKQSKKAQKDKER